MKVSLTIDNIISRNSYQILIADAIHRFQCNGCEKAPIIGNKYNCPSCNSYYLCQECKSKGVHNYHPFEVFTKPEGRITKLISFHKFSLLHIIYIYFQAMFIITFIAMNVKCIQLLGSDTGVYFAY